MKLIIGLGNHDVHFNGTRHNIGFAVLEMLAAAHNLEWQQKDKFKATIAEGFINEQKVLLAKPTTYYNLCGDAAQLIRQFYKIDNANILVAHDELALPFGTLRTRIGGNDAGNNGIKSVIGAIGDDFARLRIGIANELTLKQDAADFVLGRFNKTENESLGAIKKQATGLIEQFLQNSFEHTTIK